MMLKSKKAEDYFKLAQAYADVFSGCTKVKVGSVIVNKSGLPIAFGANITVPDLCRQSKYGCQRVAMYGENSKKHRNPEDCRAIHSEIDALMKLQGERQGLTMYITRYPCESCARAICSSGIQRVFYGREHTISPQTKDIFQRCGVDCYHIATFDKNDNNN